LGAEFLSQRLENGILGWSEAVQGDGKAFAAIGHLLPSAWAMDGFQNIILRGLSFSSVLLPAGLLLAYALAFFGLALWRFKFE
jgi:ABC-2 type transport system permease protein